jgi:hypothetical protein
MSSGCFCFSVLAAKTHLLRGLIETENSSVLELLRLINLSPASVLEKIRELLS